MSAHLRELLDLLLRWVHLIAGIMWIGNSMLFNWLDRNLEQEEGAPKGSEGRIWMVHSGGFYDVVKKQLAPNELPARLHWFKWQNFTTWASGIGLLVVVYYAGGGLLVDPTVRALSVPHAVAIGIGTIVGAWVVYDLLCRVFAKSPLLFGVIGFTLLFMTAFGLSRALSGRAAYIHVGVVLGTIMTGNVWMVIVPSQRELVAATQEGRAQDPEIGKRAKQRSIHNNYMTFPLLFVMISNHFPSTYGQHLAWIVLAVLTLGGALVRHFMNIRFWYKAWFPMASLTVVGSIAALFVLTRPKAEPAAAPLPTGPVSWATAKAILDQRCVPCHAQAPTDDVWKVAPVGVMLDTPARAAAAAARIKERVYVQKTMPLANKTQITDAERATLAAWADQGAPTAP